MGGPEPKFVMRLNQTMTMDYVPKDQQEAVENPMKSVVYHKTDDLVIEPPVPQVVRGSFVIKNPLETGNPAFVDVVDDEEEITVEDNTNLFHGQYRALKENPLYASDQDLRNVESRREITVEQGT